jgi:hypothetical protein
MAKLSDLLKAESPISGKTVSLTDIGGLWSLILGGVVIFFVTATAQNIANRISTKLPMIDTRVEPLTQGVTVSNNEIIV